MAELKASLIAFGFKLSLPKIFSIVEIRKLLLAHEATAIAAIASA
jgi:hypothetical protein